MKNTRYPILLIMGFSPGKVLLGQLRIIFVGDLITPVGDGHSSTLFNAIALKNNPPIITHTTATINIIPKTFIKDLNFKVKIIKPIENNRKRTVPMAVEFRAYKMLQTNIINDQKYFF